MSRKKKIMLWTLLGAVVIVVACIAAYFFIFHKANPPLATNQLKIGNAVFNVEIASTMVQKARGLSYRASLGDGDGMLFPFASATIQSFWMKDMNFALDMIWIGPPAGPGAQGEEVLGFAQNAVPQPGVPLWNLTIYNSPDGTDKVLEVNAGTVAKDGIKVGDAVQIDGV